MAPTKKPAPTLSFWAFGDLHYKAVAAWHDFHTLRLSSMFDDVQALWQLNEDHDRPAFCVSPGDIADTCSREDHSLARSSLVAQLGDMPFYPGIGNHEYQSGRETDPFYPPDVFLDTWGKPLRYSWEAAGYLFIMLDYPDPGTLEDPDHFIKVAPETLSFLDTTLAEHVEQSAIVLLHCPLRGTVQDRNPKEQRDFNSEQNFFSPENSDEVRAILRKHGNVRLFLSGHTHSGWEAPNLVVTEHPRKNPVTFVNLMSPWFTGRNTGPKLSADLSSFQYIADSPNVVASFSFRLYPDYASIRVREHTTRTWLKEWEIPFPTPPKP